MVHPPVTKFASSRCIIGVCNNNRNTKNISRKHTCPSVLECKTEICWCNVILLMKGAAPLTQPIRRPEDITCQEKFEHYLHAVSHMFVIKNLKKLVFTCAVNAPHSQKLLRAP